MPTKLRRVVKNSLSVQNRVNGFDQNMANCIIDLFNNTAYGNGGIGFNFTQFPTVEKIFRNNLAWRNRYEISSGSSYWISDHNSWNGGVTISDSDFINLDISKLAA